MTPKSISFEMRSEVTLLQRTVPCQRVLELVLTAPAASARVERVALNLALVIDRSGSMSGEKLEYVKLAAQHVLDQLQTGDRLAITAYDDEVQVVSESVPVTGEVKTQLRAKIHALRTGGSTNLCEGWLRGCQFVADTLLEKGVNRALLLTDGLANVGITDLEEIGRHAREIYRRGVSTSTFGVGLDFNEHLLENLANQGGGTFYYIDSPNLIPDLFLKEFKDLAQITARDVEVSISLPPSVDVQVLGGWKFEKTTDSLTLSLGSLPAGQKREVYLKVLLPPQTTADSLEFQAVARAKSEEGELLEERVSLTFQYADQAAVDAAPQDAALLERFSSVSVAEAANDALKLERQGRREEARQRIMLAIAEMPNLSEQDRLLYQEMAERTLRGMDELERKRSHYEQYATRQRR